MGRRYTDEQLDAARDLAMDQIRRDARERGEPDPMGEEIPPSWLVFQIQLAARRRNRAAT